MKLIVFSLTIYHLDVIIQGMLRVFLLLFFLLINCPTYAGVYEDAIKKHEHVFLYLYTDECGYCNKFNPVYEKLLSKYNGKIGFVKVNTRTPYGAYLGYSFRVRYVPYVVITDSKTRNSTQISTNCILNYKCAENAVRAIAKIK